MAAGPQRPKGAASNVDYWLRRCEGFRVDSPDGRVGFVEEVRYESRLDRPDVIAVRVGLLARLLLIVPVGEIAEILPGDERIVLHRSPRPTARERLQDRRERVRPGGRRRTARSEVEGVGAGAKRIDARKEVDAVIERLTRRIGLRFGKGGEREMTPDVEASAEPSAEEPSSEAPSTEEQPEEEPAAEEAPAEAAAEAMPAEEPAAEEPPVEEQTSEQQTTD
jgi:hypothetical protein